MPYRKAQQTATELFRKAIVKHAGEQLESGLSELEPQEDGLHFTFRPKRDAAPQTLVCTFDAMANPVIKNYWTLWWSVLGTGCDVAVGLSGGDAVNFTNAVYVLKNGRHALRQARDEEGVFDATAKKYRAMSVKPELPEDARKFKVQAELFTRQKRYAEAIERYAQGLAIAPWWPQGHSNRALLLAQTGRYAEAIAEMKRYIALVPEAPDARKAQDKIYQWEALTPPEESAAPAGAPSPPEAPRSGFGSL